jgi:hypothetical protein
MSADNGLIGGLPVSYGVGDDAVIGEPLPPLHSRRAPIRCTNPTRADIHRPATIPVRDSDLQQTAFPLVAPEYPQPARSKTQNSLPSGSATTSQPIS